MTPTDERFPKENLERLVAGTLHWEEVKQAIRMDPKDKDRFSKYLEILQDKVPWDDRILLRISDHLYIVAKEGQGRLTKCDCGHEFGDYRINWKLACKVYVRRTDEEIGEIITIPEVRYNPELVEMREFYCPGCYALLGVEVVPPGYPPVFEMLPDLDILYRDWLGQPLPDDSPDWFVDKTLEKTAAWAREG